METSLFIFVMLWNLKFGDEPWEQKYIALNEDNAWSFQQLPPRKDPLRLNGFIASNTMSMELLNNKKKHIWLSWEIIKKKVSIVMKLLLWLLIWTLFGFFLKLHMPKNWELLQMDIHNEFLHGDLKDEI